MKAIKANPWTFATGVAGGLFAAIAGSQIYFIFLLIYSNEWVWNY